ncbi:hypothetical protein [Aestuariivirga litoralis]|nr:hypothetical protein [Aestuariivirga litoralis]
MNEFFNWNNSQILIQHNWYWLLLALAVGCIVGFRTAKPRA